MKVRELVAMLAKADPNDIVAIEADAKCLLLLNQRLGMFQPLDQNEACAATLTEMRQGIPPCFACAVLASVVVVSRELDDA